MGIDVYASWPGMTPADVRAQHTGFSIAHGHTGYLREAYHGSPYATRTLVPEAFDGEQFEKDWVWECDTCLGTGLKPDDELPDDAPDYAKERNYGGNIFDDRLKCEDCDGMGAIAYEGAPMPVDRLFARLPAAIFAALVRSAQVYGDEDALVDLTRMGVTNIEPPENVNPGEIDVSGDLESSDAGDELVSELTEGLRRAHREANAEEWEDDPDAWKADEEGTSGGGLAEALASTFADMRAIADGEDPTFTIDDVPDAMLDVDMMRHLCSRHAMVASLVSFVRLAAEKEYATDRPVRVVASW